MQLEYAQVTVSISADKGMALPITPFARLYASHLCSVRQILQFTHLHLFLEVVAYHLVIVHG